jgi:hypothetical protein
MPRDVDDTTGMVLIDALPAERMFDIFAPMKWPEYLRVGDLPFNELLYATWR